MKINKNTLKYLFLSILLIILVPQVFAVSFRTGISPLNKGIETISNLFNINILQTNETVQVGFLKFMIFIVLFSVSFYGLKVTKIFDKDNNKTAGIVSFAFSMIGTFMMPTDWLKATGGLITLIMSSVIFLGFFIGLAIVAMFVLKPKKEDDPMGWVMNLLGIVLLLLLITLLDDWISIAQVPGLTTMAPLLFLASEKWIRKIMKR